MSDPQEPTVIWADRDDAAGYHRIDRAVLRLWIHRGHVKAKRDGARLLVDLVSLERYAAQRKTKRHARDSDLDME